MSTSIFRTCEEEIIILLTINQYKKKQKTNTNYSMNIKKDNQWTLYPQAMCWIICWYATTP